MKKTSDVFAVGSVAGGGTVRNSVRSSLFVLSLVLAFGASAPLVFAATVASQVDQYTSNDGTFTRSSTAGTGNIVSQTTNPNGSVTMSINNATSYADSGFYTKTMKLRDVKSVTVIGSGTFGVNIWLDASTTNDAIPTNGKFFTWDGNGNHFASYGGDEMLSDGPVPNSGTLSITDSSTFTSYLDNQPHTLADLKVLYHNADITFWVGTTAMTGGTQSATITAFDIEKSGSLAPASFGVMDFSGVKGYSADFGLTDATLANTTSIVVKLYSGNTLLQTNTATAKLATDYPTSPIFSGPFDVFGTFPYVTDGDWTNVREAEYGQTLTPTRVVATVTLANGKVVTAENVNLTGDLTFILVSAKTAAHTALATALGTYPQGNYTAENWTTLTGFKTDGDTAIGAATDLAGVATAQSNATTGMAGVQQMIHQNTVSSQIDQYTSNDGTFTRSSTAGTGNIVSQTTNQDGSVTMNINGASGYADSGFYTKTMKLGDVKSVTVIGSGTFGVNIWLDASTTNDSSTNGKFFTWDGNGNHFVSTDGDGFFSAGPVPVNNTLTINGDSSFDSQTSADTSIHKFADLKAAYSNADITFWVGTTAMTGGTQSATITAFDIEKSGSLAAQDFGVWNESGVKGYSAGVNLTDATFTGATVVMKLYSGSTLLQTNTATTTGFAGLNKISSPFDVLGSFDYVADGYWTNHRESEYGQTLAPTKVEATVTLANGKVVTAENLNLTGTPFTLESIAITSPATKLSYTVGDTLSIAGLVVTGTYSNTSISTLSVIPANVTGFNSSVSATGQVLTITIGGKTVNYTVDITATQNNGGGNNNNNNNGGGGGGSISIPATPATPAVPTVSPAKPATPATPATPANGRGQVLGAAMFNFTKALAVGSRGADVTALQQFLSDNKFFSETPTGYFGQLTKKAVIAFQKARGIANTGYVGPLTRGELNKGSASSGVTVDQMNSILTVLQSFNVDQAIIDKVRAALTR